MCLILRTINLVRAVPTDIVAFERSRHPYLGAKARQDLREGGIAKRLSVIARLTQEVCMHLRLLPSDWPSISTIGKRLKCIELFRDRDTFKSAICERESQKKCQGAVSEFDCSEICVSILFYPLSLLTNMVKNE